MDNKFFNFIETNWEDIKAFLNGIADFAKKIYNLITAE